MSFIEEIAVYVQKYAPQYGIKVCSPIIAQAFLESANGMSDKVVAIKQGGIREYRHNYFGLKWRNGRCAISNDYFEEWTYERENGKTIKILAKFCKFKSMEDCVIGYFQWTNIKNYANLKGVTDPKTYLENIKKDGYATDEKYVDKVMAVVEKYDLTKYDNIDSQGKESDNMITLNTGAGHAAPGNKYHGAVGFIDESKEAREVLTRLNQTLLRNGIMINDCTIDEGKSKKDIIDRSVKLHIKGAKYDVSIHFNSFSVKSANGTEVLIYSDKARILAQNVANEIGKLGYIKRGGGVKVRKDLRYLRTSPNPAILIECCFVTNANDVKKYNADTMAQAIANGILKTVGKQTTDIKPTVTNNTTKPSTNGLNGKYVNAGLNYSLVFNPTYYSNKYADLKKAFGSDEKKLFKHFIDYGMIEGRQASSNFNVRAYKNNYEDLRKAFGDNLPKYYRHYIEFGYTEKRKAL